MYIYIHVCACNTNTHTHTDTVYVCTIGPTLTTRDTNRTPNQMNGLLGLAIRLNRGLPRLPHCPTNHICKTK